jgi:hypothetical protein
LVAEDIADGRGDVALGEDPRRELIEQRLEQVMVGAVDDRDIDIGGAPSRLAAKSPPKPAPTIATRWRRRIPVSFI